MCGSKEGRVEAKNSSTWPFHPCTHSLSLICWVITRSPHACCIFIQLTHCCLMFRRSRADLAGGSQSFFDTHIPVTHLSSYAARWKRRRLRRQQWLTCKYHGATLHRDGGNISQLILISSFCKNPQKSSRWVLPVFLSIQGSLCVCLSNARVPAIRLLTGWITRSRSALSISISNVNQHFCPPKQFFVSSLLIFVSYIFYLMCSFQPKICFYCSVVFHTYCHLCAAFHVHLFIKPLVCF